MTWRSVLLYPLRRRWSGGQGRIDFKNGVSFISPSRESLAGLVEEIWVARCYERWEFRSQPGHDIVDIGAHVGVFAVRAALAYPEARVIAVEPSPDLCRFLRKNVAGNRLNNVVILESACAGSAGEGVLYARSSVDCPCLYPAKRHGEDSQPVAQCSLTTLDDLFMRFEVHECDLLKLDCEGAEYEVLLCGSRETLRKIARIAVEYHTGINEHTPAELTKFLERQGFEVELSPPREEDAGYLYATRRAAVPEGPHVRS